MVEIRFFLQDQGLELQHISIMTPPTPSTLLSVPSDLERKIPSEEVPLPRKKFNLPRFLAPLFNLTLSSFVHRRLRKRRRTPISLLPPELLSSIFEAVLKNDNSIRTALTLSHICTFWRVVALSVTALWTTVDFSRSIEGGAEFLRRSNMRVIDLTMPPLPVRSSTDKKAVTPFEPQHFNRARSLTWHARVPFKASLDFTDDSMYAFNMRHLDLRGIALSPWGRFADLTDIALHNLPRAICPSSGDLFALMKRSPAIRNVSFKDLDPMISPPTAGGDAHLCLPHLDSFQLSGPVASALFCSESTRLIIPTTAPLWRPCTTHAHDLSRVFWHGDTRRLLVNPDGISLIVGGTIVGHTGFEAADPSILSNPTFLLLTGVARTLDVALVKTLWCRDYCNNHEHPAILCPPVVVWQSLLDRMNDLEEIYLNALSAFMLHFLVALWPYEPIAAERELYRPALRRLDLETGLQIPREESGALGAFLVRHIQWRKRWINEPLELLKINFGEDEQHEKLRGLVKVLVIADDRAPQPLDTIHDISPVE